jgi:hypothetical protein
VAGSVGVAGPGPGRLRRVVLEVGRARDLALRFVREFVHEFVGEFGGEQQFPGARVRLDLGRNAVGRAVQAGFPDRDE